VTSEGYGEALPLQAVAAGVAMDQHTRDTQAAASDQVLVRIALHCGRSGLGTRFTSDS
jgi:hypothetical protein